MLCIFCKKIFSKKFTLERHYESCKIVNNMSIINIIKTVTSALTNEKTKEVQNEEIIVKNIFDVCNNISYLNTNDILSILTNIDKSYGENYEFICVNYLHKIFNNIDYPENMAVQCINKTSKIFRIIDKVDDKSVAFKKKIDDTIKLLTPCIKEIFKKQFELFLLKYTDFDLESYKKPSRFTICCIFIKPTKSYIASIIKKFLIELTY